jgi:hypothetical protein
MSYVRLSKLCRARQVYMSAYLTETGCGVWFKSMIDNK